MGAYLVGVKAFAGQVEISCSLKNTAKRSGLQILILVCLGFAPVVILLSPLQLIHNCNNSWGVCGDIAGTLCIVSRRDDAAQPNPAVVAVNHHGIIVSNSILGQAALDLSY